MLRLRPIPGLLSLCLAIVLVGCGKGESQKPGSSEASSSSSGSDDPVNVDQATVQGAAGESAEEMAQPSEDQPQETAQPNLPATGTLEGVVLFKGDPPAPRKIQITKDEEICSAGEGEVQDVVVKDGKLVGAVIELSVRGQVPDFNTPEGGFVIRQKDCRFSPRQLVAFNGAMLTVYNDDKVAHNVNTGSWNLLQSPGSDPIQQEITYQGSPWTRVTCNIHSWMESWVYVARSPYYAVTDENGAYRIDGIPVGVKIRGTVSHPALRTKRFDVTASVDAIAGRSFEFDAR